MALPSYRQIFERVCDEFGVVFDAAGFDWLIEARHRPQGRELLACYPRDLVGRVRDFALYEGLAGRASAEALDRAWTTYFTTVGATAGGQDINGSTLGETR
jgi:hypothetical protein